MDDGIFGSSISMVVKIAKMGVYGFATHCCASGH
jgi:hypothetical protein